MEDSLKTLRTEVERYIKETQTAIEMARDFFAEAAPDWLAQLVFAAEYNIGIAKERITHIDLALTTHTADQKPAYVQTKAFLESTNRTVDC